MLARIFGVSFDDNLAVEFADCPDVVPQIQNKLSGFDKQLHENNVSLSLFLDDVLLQIIPAIQPDLTNSPPYSYSTLSDDDLFNQPEIRVLGATRSAIITQYLESIKRRCDTLSHNNDNAGDKELMEFAKKRVNICQILMMRGFWPKGAPNTDELITYITYNMLQNRISPSTLVKMVLELVEEESVDSGALPEVFNAIFSKLRRWIIMASKNNRLNPKIQGLATLLHALLSVTHNGKRPLAEVLVAREDFIPALYTAYPGREIIGSSFLGPVLAMSTISDDEQISNLPNLVDDLEQFRDIPRRNSVYEKFQPLTDSLRVSMHSIIHVLLVNASSRNKTLKYLANVLQFNSKRTQMNANMATLANSSVMLNVVSILLQLSEKITLDKVQDNYIFHPNSLIKVTDEPCISFAPDAVESIRNDLDVSYELKFPAECFYMTMYSMHVGFNATVEHAGNARARVTDIRRTLRDFQESLKHKGPLYSENPLVKSRVEHLRNMEKRCTFEYMSHQVLLHNDLLMLQCIKFVNRQFELILRSISADFVNNTLPSSPPKVFGALPELFIESALDFMVFILREGFPTFAANSCNITEHLLVLCCCLSFFKNPYLASKVVDVVFRMTPMVNPMSDVLFRRIVENNFAGQRLFPSLSKFYTDVESTGAHTEFYDKFNIRRSIQVIFKSMWTHLIYRRSMIDVAENDSPQFVRFINMIINDATFLLDESLTGLKKIRDIEALMDDEAEFNALSEDDRNMKIGALNEVKRSVRTWMILCNDTLDFFILLSTGNATIFYNTLGDRIAAMLNYNIVQLCGPKCIELKVKDAKARFEWDPRKLMQQIVDIYLNLRSDTFAKHIAQDERSFTPETFAAIIERMKSRRILDVSNLEHFQNLIEMSNHYYRQKAQEEMDYGDDIPSDFLDELFYTLMAEPVRLPSGQVVDKKHIMRHLLNDKTNPFTRQPLTVEELVPDLELKKRIDNWVAEKRAAAAAQLKRS